MEGGWRPGCLAQVPARAEIKEPLEAEAEEAVLGKEVIQGHLGPPFPDPHLLHVSAVTKISSLLPFLPQDPVRLLGRFRRAFPVASHSRSHPLCHPPSPAQAFPEPSARGTQIPSGVLGGLAFPPAPGCNLCFPCSTLSHHVHHPGYSAFPCKLPG